MKAFSGFALVVCIGVFVLQACVDYASLDRDGGNECTPNCKDKCCGDDGCGGTCTDDCSRGDVCNPANCRCEGAPKCETNEDCPRNYWCDRTVWTCRPIECIPNCTGKCCGPDGCDGTCPNNCPVGYYCNEISCQCRPSGCQTDADCTYLQCCVTGVCTDMSCGTLECGPDPVCGMECGPCGAGTHCDQGSCEPDVTCTTDAHCAATECCINGNCTAMACGSLECGPDPVCGKECGPCPVGHSCVNGWCATGGNGKIGDPCNFGDVNATADSCEDGLVCLGIPADGNAGTCPGGSATECTELMEAWNPDCVGGNCGVSFCTEECGDGGRCPAGFQPADVAGICFCIPLD